jgi:hypothetical protein
MWVQRMVIPVVVGMWSTRLGERMVIEAKRWLSAAVHVPEGVQP